MYVFRRSLSSSQRCTWALRWPQLLRLATNRGTGGCAQAHPRRGRPSDRPGHDAGCRWAWPSSNFSMVETKSGTSSRAVADLRTFPRLRRAGSSTPKRGDSRTGNVLACQEPDWPGGSD